MSTPFLWKALEAGKVGMGEVENTFGIKGQNEAMDVYGFIFVN